MSQLHVSSQSVSLTGGRTPRVRQHGPAHWAARLSAVLIWGAAGFVTAYWVVAWVGQGTPTALPAQPWVPPEVDSQAAARALGAQPVDSGPLATPSDASGRYALMGVVADGREAQSRRSHSGVALIATDGQRARPYAVGAQVDGRWVVHSVAKRAVVLLPVGATEPAGDQATPENAPGAITLVLPKP